MAVYSDSQAQDNGEPSLVSLARQYTDLESFGTGWWRGKCFREGCSGELTLYPSDGELLFACDTCRAKGDVRDFQAAVGGGELLDRLGAFIRRFVALSVAQADMIALWIVHTHAFDAADATPYLSGP